MAKIAALIAAGGSGARFGDQNLPKQYHLLDGEPILARTIKAFLFLPEIAMVKVVIGKDHDLLYRAAIKNLNNHEKKLLSPIIGGSERNISVQNGLKALQDTRPDIVLIHDGCRPFVTADLIKKIIAATKIHGAAIPVIPSTDTLKEIENGLVKKTIDRSKIFKVQTPQGFLYEDLLQLSSENLVNVTDDASIYENNGKPVFSISGEASNIKITTKEELK